MLFKKKVKLPVEETVEAEDFDSNGLSSDRLLMLFTIIDRTKADYFIDTIQEHEVNLQLSAMAQGTVTKDLIEMLGLDNSDKTVLFSIIKEEKEEEILEMLDKKFKTVKKAKGIAFTVPLTSVIGVSSYGFLSNNEAVIKKGE